MRLSKKTIDKEKKPCYGERGGKISAFIVERRAEPSEERLLKAMNLILSEKDVIDYFTSREHSFLGTQKRFQDKENGNSLKT